MTSLQPAVELTGEAVTVSGVADPAVSYGQFRLENHGQASEIASLGAVWLEVGERRQPLAQVTLFDVSHDQELEPGHFEIEPGTTINFLVGFPKVAYEARAGEFTVCLELHVGGADLEARSPVTFVQRIPRGRD